MLKYFLFTAAILAIPANTWTMENQVIIAKPITLSPINISKDYQHNNTPIMPRRKPTPCHDSIDFINLINKFGQASNANDYELQNELFHQIDTMLKNENKLNGYHPALTLRNLKISSIYSGTPLQALKYFEAYHMDPINKNAYLRVCEYITRNKPLHRHILSLIERWFEKTTSNKHQQTPKVDLPTTPTGDSSKTTHTHCQTLMFNILINKFDTKTDVKEIITYIKNKNYLHEYGPMVEIRNLSHGNITDESPFYSSETWAQYQPIGINKKQYKELCLELITIRAKSKNEKTAQKFHNIYLHVESITK